MIVTRIDSMTYGGYGVARVDGFVHFVPESAPGDLVEITPVVQKKKYGFSRLLRIVEPSPIRTEPFCRYFGDCGGCQLQHIRYSEQLKIKQKVFLEQMERIGGISNLPEPAILGSEARRTRMRFQIRKGGAGLFKRKSHAVCRIEECGIASQGVNRVLQALQEIIDSKGMKLHGSVTVLAAPSGTVISIVLAKGDGQKLYQELGKLVQGGTILKRGKRFTLGDSLLPVEVGRIQCFAAADFFWQASPEINELLVNRICGFMAGTEKVVDLYSGCGNITLPLSSVCKEVVGIERDFHSVEAARHSASMAGIENISFFSTDILDAEIDADGLVLDPPRSGLPPVLLNKIGEQRPRKIAYLSCNPSTLARDLRRLIDMGYSVSSIQLFDMFPHTHHIESLVFVEAED